MGFDLVFGTEHLSSAHKKKPTLFLVSDRNLISLLYKTVHSKTAGDIIAKELEKWLCKLDSDILLSVSLYVSLSCLKYFCQQLH